MSINRAALIIHSGSEEQRQPEVERIRAFLQSNHGGAWEHYEITVAPDDCSEEWLKEYFQRSRSMSFFLLFYIGRKYFDERKGIMYCLPNGEKLSWMWLRIKTRDVPTLLITDGCRQGTDERKGGERRNDNNTTDMADDKKRKLCRKMYDEALEYPAWGMFVTASSDNMESTRQAAKSDGSYLDALFEATEKILTSSSRKPGIVYNISDVHKVAAKKVKELSGGEQTPSLTGVNKKRQLPFLVKMRKRKKKKTYKTGIALMTAKSNRQDDLPQSSA